MKRIGIMLTLVFLVSPCVQAHQYHKGIVVRMSTVKCAGTEHRGVIDALAGSATEEDSCHEFTLKDEKVVYRIRTHKDHLLPLGEDVEFRLSHREMIVRAENASEELKFTVVSMSLIGEADEEDRKAIKLFANRCSDSEEGAVHCRE